MWIVGAIDCFVAKFQKKFHLHGIMDNLGVV
jgi:hypothetical protein